MVMNISCKFEKASYNIFSVRAVTVKSLYTLRQWRNEAVDTNNGLLTKQSLTTVNFCP